MFKLPPARFAADPDKGSGVTIYLDSGLRAMAQIDSVGQALRALRRRAVLVACILIVGCLGALWYALNAARVYEATAGVQIEASQIALTPTGGAGLIENRIRLIEQKLMSRETLLEVIRRHDLFPGHEDISETQRVALLRASVQIQRLIDPAQGWRPDVQPTGLQIVVGLDNAEQAAAVANDFLEMVMVEGRERATRRAETTLAFFDAQVDRIGTEIAAVEDEIAALKLARAGALPDAASTRAERLTLLRAAQLEIEQQIISFETSRDRLRDEEARRQAALLEQQSLLIAGRITEVQALIDAAPEVERRLNMLERSRSQLLDEYTVATARRAEAAVTQVLEDREQSERFEVLEVALVPEHPVSTERRQLLLMGVLMSLMAAVGAALGLEWISPGLRSSAQIERALGLRPVVVIPDLRVPRGRRLSGA